MSENKIWQSFGELNDPDNFQKQHEDEFKEELPFEGFDDKGLIDAKAPRRDFLKYVGFSTAAATLAASCKIPVRKAIPYANKPENLVPGVAKYYATTYVQDGDVTPIVAKVRDGRPIKIEGNDQSKLTNGGTSARVQASVLDLYDTNRVKFPQQKTKEGKFEEVPTFEQFDRLIGDAMKASTGAVVLLSSTIVSPTTKKIISEFPGLRHVQYDAVSYSGMLSANEASGFGRKIPSYHFEAAKVIVSLNADFLGTWLSPVEFARGYSKGRKIDEKDPKMSKHYQFESRLSPTGANADERYTHRPSQTSVVANALLSAVLGTASIPEITDAKLKKGIERAAADLNANMGAALVVCGSNDINVQVIVNAINAKIGAYGKTIDWSAPVNYRQGIDKDMFDLVEDMNAGKIGTLLICSSNPSYTYHDAEKFNAGLKKVNLSVSFSGKMDETTERCNHIIPDHHFLESWGDAEAKAGYTSFLQPTIFPLFKTRHFQTSLMRWSGNNASYEDYFRDYWTSKLGSADVFDKVLQDGIIEPAETTFSAGTYNNGAIASAISAVSTSSMTPVQGAELLLYEKVSIGSGAQSGNPWLQELPDPISKATWDNYAMISIPKAKELGIKVDRDYEYYPEKPVISLKVGKNEIEIPVLVIPGMNADTIAVALGYGRSEGMGKTAAGVGKNAYIFSSFDGSNVMYRASGVTTTKLNKKYKIAQTQRHNSYEGRIEVVRETTLATYKKEPGVIPEYRDEMAKDFASSTGDFRKEATLYPQHDQPGIKWGMTIDMNSCIACSACIVACHAENNVPVVGKREVLRYHDMHWLRIDRYFVSDKDTPDDLKGVIFQPMLCQHCDNAPCENVCPVAATNHSSEGINQMAYNRCIGTRYCAQNCPFKVRRFNWADYTGADSFPHNQDQKLIGRLDDVVFQMNEDLSRMVLNPDVTVRSRGVMEKCTFCVQKLQAAKLDAKKENRILKDGDAKTACQTACPTEAIVFGNAHDNDSQISRMRQDNPNRGFYVLDQLHVLPNITYFEKVRNTDEIIESEKHGESEAGVKEENSKDKLSVPSATYAVDTTHL